ncbi:MAG: hypothetical protein ACTH2Q_13160 [Propionibacteriaceae bacterium]
MQERERLEGTVRDFSVLALVVTVLFVVGYVFGVLVPYYVNDLDAYSLIEVTRGDHDPEGLWPNTVGPAGRALYVVGFLTAILSWIVLPVLAGLSLVGLVLARRWRTAVGCYLVAVLLSVGTLIFQYSDLGRGLVNWMLS